MEILEPAPQTVVQEAPFIRALRPLRVEAEDGLAGLLRIRDDWQRLHASMRRPRYVHEWGWWHAWLSALDDDPSSFSFYVVRDESRVAAIIPSQSRTRRRFGLACREIGLPAHSHMPIADVLCRDDIAIDDVLQAWFGYLRQIRWDCARFPQVLSESSLAGMSPSPMAVVRAAPPCSYLPCEAPYEQVQKRYSQNFRSQLKKANNRWKSVTGADMVCATEPDAVRRAFDELLRVEASGWKGRMGTAIAQDPKLERFYRELMEAFLPSRQICIMSLVAEGHAIAVQFCLLDHDTLYALKVAYDEAWERYSPGNLLLDQVLRHGCESGQYRCVNLVTDAAWHRGWRPERTAVHDYVIFNGTPAGQLLRAEVVARRFARSALRVIDRWRARLRHDSKSASDHSNL